MFLHWFDLTDSMEQPGEKEKCVILNTLLFARHKPELCTGDIKTSGSTWISPKKKPTHTKKTPHKKNKQKHPCLHYSTNNHATPPL